MWIPKCCTTTTDPTIDEYLTHSINFYRDDKVNEVINSRSINKLVSTLILDSSTCGKAYIKNRSAAAQDTAIQAQLDPNTSIELIFKYFPFKNYNFTRFTWGESSYIFRSIQPLAEASIRGKRFSATSQAPFIQIIGSLTSNEN